jgi:hypothetical protein
MHLKVLSQWLADRLVVGHASRKAALLRAVDALLSGGKLSLTHLGRSLAGGAHVKHQIKAIDRLLGNEHLGQERDGIYAAVIQTLLLGNKRPVIVVDWSDFQSGRQWAMIKAAVPVGGRALSLYERVFPFKRYNSPGAHREFLAALRAVLPPDCRPLIVTDAGFRGPWFRDVEAYGWDWLGRIRNRVKFYSDETSRWRFTQSLYPQATSKPLHIGEVTLSRQRGYRVRLYLVRASKPRIGRPRRHRAKRPNEAAYQRAHREPWLLATSLPHACGSGHRVAHLYAKRMQIEETFRDLKCHRWGFGLCYSQCHNTRRLEALLLLAALATLVVWLVGLAARALQLHRHLQANTEQRREVLSTFFIGRELLRRPIADLRPPSIDRALTTLRAQILEAELV